MTNPVAPPEPLTVPVYPPLGSLTFNQDAYNYANAMPAVSIRFGEMGQAAYTNALSAKESVVAANDAASAAQKAAASAGDSAALAAGAASFRGLWPTLAAEPDPAKRQLNRPAAVKHKGRIWLLLQDLADVALHEPAEGAYWTAREGGIVTATVTANTTMVAGVRYVVAAAGVVLSLPAAPMVGDPFAAVDASGSGFKVNFGAHTVKGKTPDSPMAVPALRGFDVTYTGSTLA